MNYYPALHTLRGFAAIWVLLLHSWVFSGTPPLFFSSFLSQGWNGVHLFYLLSAFLLGSIYFNQIENNSWNILKFYKKRFLRIFPAYYFQFGIILILCFFGIYYKLPSIQDLFAHAFLFFNLPPSFTPPLNGVWWTLPVEFMFYLIMPILTWLLIKIGWIKFLILSFIVTFFYRYTIFNFMQGQPVPVISNIIGQLPGVLMIFSIGLTSAYLISNKKYNLDQSKHKGFLIMLLLLFWFWSKILLDNVTSYWNGSYLLFIWESVNAIILMLFILNIYQSKSIFLVNGFFVWLGKISYGIYLWHLPVILIIKDSVQNFYQMLFITVPITLLLASISYYLIEKRFSKLKI